MLSSAATNLSQASDWLRGPGLEIVLLVLAAVLFSRFVSWIRDVITTRIDEGFRDGDALVRTEAAKHRHAVAQVVSWVLLTIVYLLVGLEVLQRFGFDMRGLVAPAAVLGAALGFGAQRIVQDILAGFFLITERQYGYGDVVSIALTGNPDTADGIVEDLTLRITRLRSPDGEMISVPNGQILKVTNLSKDWARAVVDVPVPATADITVVNEILHRVGSSAIKDATLAPLLLDEPSVMGLESLEMDEMSIRMVARTLPGKQFQVSRELRMRIVAAMRTAGLNDVPPPREETVQ